MKKTLSAILIVILAIFSSVGFAQSGNSNEAEQRNILKFNSDLDRWEWMENMDYARGFNDALMCISLLNLELSIEDERKTFGEMNAVCRERFKIKGTESNRQQKH